MKRRGCLILFSGDKITNKVFYNLRKLNPLQFFWDGL
jgi:hypothetical protein